MLYVMSSLIICIILSMVFIFLNLIIGKSMNHDREKSSPYECGFEAITTTRVSFSLRFFLIAVIFLIFDLEVVLIFPIILKSTCSYDWLFTLSMILFLFILSTGLAHEWNEGSLNWKD